MTDTDKKDDEKKDDEKKDDEKKDDEKKDEKDEGKEGGQAAGGSGLSVDDVRNIVKEVLGESREGDERRTIIRRSDLEEQARKMVEEAQARITEELEHKKDHDKLKEEKKEPEKEKTPAKSPRLRRVLWGE